jgi:hypothetical protein
MTRPDEPITPMTLGNMRHHGVRGLFATCRHCGHETEVNVEALAGGDRHRRRVERSGKTAGYQKAV